MDAVAAELVSRMMQTILTLEAEIARLKKEIADAAQVGKERLPKHEGAPKA